MPVAMMAVPKPKHPYCPGLPFRKGFICDNQGADVHFFCYLCSWTNRIRDY